PSCFATDPQPPDASPLSLHDALPISAASGLGPREGRTPPPRDRAPRAWPPTRSSPPSAPIPRQIGQEPRPPRPAPRTPSARRCRDRKSTRLNSSHVSISYAVFCLKKK